MINPQTLDTVQMCECAIVTLFDTVDAVASAKMIQVAMESCYTKLQLRAKIEKRILVGVSQTISTESPRTDYIAYIITLVGTAVDTETIERQRRMQQFNPSLVR